MRRRFSGLGDMFEAIGRAAENRFLLSPDDAQERIQRIFRRRIRRAWLAIMVVTVVFGLIFPIRYGDRTAIPAVLLGLGTVLVVIIAMTGRTMRTIFLWTLLAVLLMALMLVALVLSSN